MDTVHWQQIEQLYNRALEMRPDEWKEFLNTSCRDNKYIRREVERLLEHQTESEDFCESSAMEVLTGIEADHTVLPIRQIGPYEISSVIGRGGMGEVYRAKDQRLDRDVAIKFLPEVFSRDALRISRFKREAKLLASLNHPGIASVHGFEEFDDTHFLILELVEGKTLAEKIREGPIPVEEALELALQITEALKAAHEKGVVHRDLKPANIKVTPDGRVKLLDFGLAKSFAHQMYGPEASPSSTDSTTATLPGLILGTAGYMSPEQARGKTVDERTDIWSFGCIFYELLAGHPTFPGESVSDILAAVILSEPDWNRLPTNLHWKLREILKRCLQKIPGDRYRDISAVRHDIRMVIDDPDSTPALPIKMKRFMTQGLQRIPRIAVAFILCILIGLPVAYYLKSILSSGQAPVIYFQYHVLPGQKLGRAGILAVSPDGSLFVYASPDGLFLRSMHGNDIRPVTGTDDDPQSPFFSPDGKWIGYFSKSDRHLKIIPISGGTPLILCKCQNVLGAYWTEKGDIIYVDLPSGIMRVPASGGLPELIFKGIAGSPQLLPDSKSVLFSVSSGTGLNGPNQVMVESLESGERKLLVQNGGACRYLPTGHLIFGLNKSLFVVPFNLEKLEINGKPIPVLEDVGEWAVSDSGTILYTSDETYAKAPQQTLIWVDRQGREELIGAPSGSYSSPQISPDGTRVAFTLENNGNSDVWIYEFNRQIMMRLTFDEAVENHPVWTPDAKYIVFHSNRDQGSQNGIYMKSADGTGETTLLLSTDSDRIFFPSTFSNAGNLLLQGIRLNPFQANIATLSMKEEPGIKMLAQNMFLQKSPEASPNGRWIAYTSNESGRDEVYIRPFPEVNKAKWRISLSGGESPLWSPNGKELFYRSKDSTMMVPIEAGNTLKVGMPKILFRSEYELESIFELTNIPWDISPDGRRFLMVKNSLARQTDGENQQEINVIVNWFEELKQRVPIP